MGKVAKKIVNSRKSKLKLVKGRSITKEGRNYNLEELLKLYPGLRLDSAALLQQAHAFFKKAS